MTERDRKSPLATAIDRAKLNHRNWVRARHDLLAALFAARPGEVVCLTGPSRAGKTELMLDVAKTYLPSTGEGGHEKPYVRIELANNSAQGKFRTKAFYRKVLAAIGNPLLAHVSGPLPGRGKGKGMDIAGSRVSEDMLYEALIRGVKSRKTQLLIVDEAQHVTYAVGGDPAAAAILDSWKCLASECNVVIAFVGAYPILNQLYLSPHMTGRTKIVELPRYRATEADRAAFASILLAFSQIIPVQNKSGSLVEWAGYLHERSLGCIGHLAQWLIWAVNCLPVEGPSALTYECLQESTLTNFQINALIKEIRDGEMGSVRGKVASNKGEPQELQNLKKGNRRPGTPRPKRHRRGNRL